MENSENKTNVSTSENGNANVSATNAEKKSKKSVSKKQKQTDAINLQNVKIDLSKGNKSLLTKEKSVASKKDLYKGTESLGEEEKKKFRGKIRRDLHRFVGNILGKDRSADERTQSVKEFLKFYKEFWKVQDFKIENFTQSKNPTDLKDYKALLSFVQSVLK